MKLLLKVFCGLFLIQSFTLQANFSEEPGLAKISAKHAKLRAKLRASSHEEDEAASDIYENDQESLNTQLNTINGSNGCNLNVGNVLIDDSLHNPPNEVNIIIQGDIIQSNNCR